MAYYPWSVPDEIVYFIKTEFQKFDAPMPTDKAIDTVADFVLTYVSERNYYPLTPTEAQARYHTPGLTEPEKHQLVAPVEYRLKVQLNEKVTFDQLHLAVWASLLFCWSQEGEGHVEWYRKTQSVPAQASFGF